MNQKNIWLRLFALMLVLAMLVGVMAGCGEDKDGSSDKTPVVENVPEDPYEYMLFVEERGFSALSDSISGVYGQVTETLGDAGAAANTNGTELRVELNLGDKLLEAMKSSLASNGLDIDPSFLRQVQLTAGLAQEGDLRLVDVKLSLNGNHILGGKMIVDDAGGASYIGLPELAEGYLKSKADTSGMSAAAGAILGKLDLSVIKDRLTALLEALPSEEILGETLHKYLTLALEQFKNVQKTTETVTLSDVSQELTVLTLNVTEQDVRNALKVLLEAAKEDANILQVCEAINSELGQLAADLGVEFPTDLAEAYKQGIDTALQQIAEGDGTENSDVLVIKTYTNSQHQVVGRSFTIAEELLGAYLFVESDTAFAVEAWVDSANVIGGGSKSAGAYTGRFTFNDGTEDLLALELRNYDPAKNTDGNVDIDLRLIPNQSEIDMSDIQAMGYSGEVTLGLRIVDNSRTVNMMVGEDTVVSAKLASQPKNYEITIPENAVDSGSSMEMLAWLTSLNTDALFENLEAAGVPMDLVEELIYELMGSVMG